MAPSLWGFQCRLRQWGQVCTGVSASSPHLLIHPTFSSLHLRPPLGSSLRSQHSAPGDLLAGDVFPGCLQGLSLSSWGRGYLYPHTAPPATQPSACPSSSIRQLPVLSHGPGRGPALMPTSVLPALATVAQQLHPNLHALAFLGPWLLGRAHQAPHFSLFGLHAGHSL